MFRPSYVVPAPRSRVIPHPVPPFRFVIVNYYLSLQLPENIKYKTLSVPLSVYENTEVFSSMTY